MQLDWQAIGLMVGSGGVGGFLGSVVSQILRNHGDARARQHERQRITEESARTDGLAAQARRDAQLQKLRIIYLQIVTKYWNFILTMHMSAKKPRHSVESLRDLLGDTIPLLEIEAPSRTSKAAAEFVFQALGTSELTEQTGSLFRTFVDAAKADLRALGGDPGELEKDSSASLDEIKALSNPSLQGTRGEGATEPTANGASPSAAAADA